MLKNYTKSCTGKLMKLKIADITEPFHIKIYWLNSLSPQSKPELINQKLHKHSFYEAHFILEGTADYAMDDGSLFQITKGNGILITPQTKHIVKRMSPDMLRFSLAFVPEQGSLPDKQLSQQDVHCFSVSDRLTDSIDMILYELEQKNIFSSILIQNRIFEIICEIIRTLEHPEYYAIKNDTSENMVILKAKQYISDNKGRMLDCTEVADYCHFNVKYLSRIFAEQTGHTLLDYIHSEKIKYAEFLLKDRALTLKQVSELLGFSNEYYFNTFFKRRNGITPGQFRCLSGN